MSERQALLGHRVEVRQQRLRQELNCEALRDRLRSLLTPLFDIRQIQRDAILDTAAVLHTELGELEVMDRKIAILDRELGE